MLRARAPQVLAIVQQQEKALRLEMAYNRLIGTLCRFLLQAERSRHRLPHERGVGERCKLYDPYAIGELLKRVGRHVQGEPCLAATTRAGQGQQPRLRKEACDLGQLLLAPYEVCNLEGKVVLQLRAIERSKWRKVGGQVRMTEVLHRFRPTEVFQAVLSQAAERNPSRKLILNQLLGRS